MEIFTPSKEIPRPFINFGNGKSVKKFTVLDWIRVIPQVLNDVEKYSYDVDCNINDKRALKFAALITAMVSYLEAKGYDADKRAELFRRVNNVNKYLGYLEA